MILLPQEYIELPAIGEYGLELTLPLRGPEGERLASAATGVPTPHSSNSFICPYHVSGLLTCAPKVAWGSTPEDARLRAEELLSAEIDVFSHALGLSVEGVDRRPLVAHGELGTALKLFDESSYQAAYPIVRSLAERGIPWAEYTLAAYLYSPNVLSEWERTAADWRLALYWFERSAKHYEGFAYDVLASLIAGGDLGFIKSESKAAEYRRRATRYGCWMSKQP